MSPRDSGPRLTAVPDGLSRSGEASAEQRRARRRHPAGRGGFDRPRGRRGPDGFDARGALVVGVLAASALLWVFLMAAMVVMYGRYLELQTLIITRMEQVTPCTPAAPRTPPAVPGVPAPARGPGHA